MSGMDLTKYYQPFFKQEDLQALGSQIAGAKVPAGDGWITLIFLAIKVFAMSTVYGMWKKAKDDQMMIDKQQYEQGIQNHIHAGDNAL